MTFQSNDFQRRLRIEPLEDRRLLAVITVNTTVDENNGIGVGGISLRDAIAAAAPADTINFASSLTSGGPATIVLTHGDLLINKSLTIDGPGANLLTINASGNDLTPTQDNGDGSRVFRMDDGSDSVSVAVTIEGLTLTGGDVTGEGGAILSYEALTVENCAIRNNFLVWETPPGENRPGGGGGIGAFSRGGPASGSLAIHGCMIEGNSTDGFGGGVVGNSVNVIITSSIVQSNSSGASGGGIIVIGVLTIDGCTIAENTAGLSGGGIALTDGLLGVSDSEIRDNTAVAGGGGIYTRFYETVTIDRSLITDNEVTGINSFGIGGGISFDSPIFGDAPAITSSTISGNTALQGGGVHSGQTLRMEGSTVDSNRAVVGGGIWARNVEMLQSTISGNTASGNGGGVALYSQYSQYSQSTISHTTIANNIGAFGAGIVQFAGELSLEHSIVANGTSAFNSSSDVAVLLDGSVIAHFSLIRSNQHSGLTPAPVGSPDANGNMIGGTLDQFIDPLLGTLSFNGGRTRNHALFAGSPAINAGDASLTAGEGGVPDFDQRGEPYVRVASGRIDIGAFERQTLAPVAFVVDTLVDEDDGNYGVGDLSLREAVRLANERAFSADVISFAPALTAGGPQTISLSMGVITISDAVTVDGTGAALLTIDASASDPTPTENNGDGSSIFSITDSQQSVRIAVFVDGFTMTGADGNRGAIENFESLTVANSVITGNSAKLQGGGIYSNGVLMVLDSNISGNVANITFADGGGGGIEARLFGTVPPGTQALTLVRSTITTNSAPNGNGGGVSATGGSTISDSTISGNSARYGGGIGGSNVTISGSAISGNSAVMDGGGIEGGQVTLERSVLTGNTAGRDGGGFDGGAVIVRESLVHNNTANRRGGGIHTTVFAAGQSTQIVNSTISGNTATTSVGGGLYTYAGPLMIRHSTITNNTATAGRGVASRAGTAFRVQFYSSIVSGNGTSDIINVGSGANTIQSLGYNIVGGGNALVFNQPGDQQGVFNPMLGALSANGGPTKTHEPLVGSPAINAGDPAAVGGSGGVPTTDQRGTPFARVAAGRIDIGALERQAIPAAVFGDYNLDDSVDAADYVVWRKMIGTTGVPAYSGADGDGDTEIDSGDYDVWQGNFGEVLPPPGTGSGAASLTLIHPAVEHGDTVVPAPVKSTPASVAPDVNFARRAIFSIFDDRATRRTSAPESRESSSTFRVAKPAGNELLHLLAVDRVGRSRPDASEFADRESEDQADDDVYGPSLTDEPLSLALANCD